MKCDLKFFILTVMNFQLTQPADLHMENIRSQRVRIVDLWLKEVATEHGHVVKINS